jgi:thymidylate kinase
MDNKPKCVEVIAIEGVHGCGKSTFCDYIRRKHSDRFIVLDEAFINEPSTKEAVQNPKYPLHPQSLVCETMWTAKWFSRVVEMREQCEGKFVIVDRSPYSAMAYVQPNEPGRVILEPLIRNSLTELREKCHINVRIIYLRVESQEVLFDRITKRLNSVRQELNEGSRAHLSAVHHFYESMISEWDEVISNETQNLASMDRVFCDFERMLL